ncbi:MAG: leucine-rich repeat protein, partial [Kiritimatiellae bacterium]|nr:leucine-rich repeat protein [Kiritimatiellia bacterium]
ASVIEYAVDDGSGGDDHAGRVTLPWLATAPVYTNVGEYVVWYRVVNPNYNEFVHAAKVTITPRTGVVVDIVGNVATNVYNGSMQSIDGYTVAINDQLYKETDFEFVGNSAVAGAAAGKYPMGLLASQFSNKSKNFTDVTFNVTDGELVILELSQKNVILDAIGGTFTDCTVVTQKCEDVYLAFPVATREGYVFDGWYLGITNGAPKAAAGAGLLVDDDHTLFAKWQIDEPLMPGGASIFAWEAIDANTVRITGFKDSAQKVSTLLLPDMIEGRLVTEIATGAFANSKSGMSRLILPMFCTKIGDKAFTGVASLSEIVFADVRRWEVPSESAMLSIGRYAFSGAGIEAVKLPKAVGVIGDYAFANCRKLANLTILGNSTIGVMPLRRAGLDVGGVTVHLDPALANDSAYMETLKQECGNITVRADAVVTRMTLSSLAVSAMEIELSVSVEKAVSWGKVDLSLVKVAYRESLSEKPIMLGPSSVTENADGSLTVKVVAPKGNSGFFQVVLENK